MSRRGTPVRPTKWQPEPGKVAAALNADVTVELIADGLHSVPPGISSGAPRMRRARAAPTSKSYDIEIAWHRLGSVQWAGSNDPAWLVISTRRDRVRSSSLICRSTSSRWASSSAIV